MSLMGRCDLE